MGWIKKERMKNMKQIMKELLHFADEEYQKIETQKQEGVYDFKTIIDKLDHANMDMHQILNLTNIIRGFNPMFLCQKHASFTNDFFGPKDDIKNALYFICGNSEKYEMMTEESLQKLIQLSCNQFKVIYNIQRKQGLDINEKVYCSQEEFVKTRLQHVFTENKKQKIVISDEQRNRLEEITLRNIEKLLYQYLIEKKEICNEEALTDIVLESMVIFEQLEVSKSIKQMIAQKLLNGFTEEQRVWYKQIHCCLLTEYIKNNIGMKKKEFEKICKNIDEILSVVTEPDRFMQVLKNQIAFEMEHSFSVREKYDLAICIKHTFSKYVAEGEADGIQK